MHEGGVPEVRVVLFRAGPAVARHWRPTICGWSMLLSVEISKRFADLLKQSVDVNTPQPDGATALAWAATGTISTRQTC